MHRTRILYISKKRADLAWDRTLLELEYICAAHESDVVQMARCLSLGVDTRVLDTATREELDLYLALRGSPSLLRKEMGAILKLRQLNSTGHLLFKIILKP